LALPGRLLIFKPSGSPKLAVRDSYSESRATLEMKIISTASALRRGFWGAAIRSCWPCLPGNFFPVGGQKKASV